ncbi:MAG: M1 family metallopeptidase [Nitrososphaeria archaeon]|nr:M1 family metallopeptidase [Conexivisphaerales archaeon]
MRITEYDIKLDVDFATGEYNGEETIYMSAINPWIDAEGLKIESVYVDGKNVKPLFGENGFSVNANVIEKLQIKFRGKALESLMGLYVAKYKDMKFYTTQFEPNGARLFIPCVDRPDYKARFRLTVHVNKETRVISNMPPVKIERGNNEVTYYFPETLPMSTYLLYLGIGDFDEIEDKMGDKKIYVAAYGGKSSRGHFALDVAKKVIAFYEGYFGIEYPLPKLHLIAVPEFAVGAMENWGAITFREIALLADEKSSESVRRSVATVVAHEIAHQWFGDLVTMKWWDDLWLNESFATFMSYKAINSVFPEWDHWEDFVLTETDPALHADSLSTTHPIHVPVNKPEEIEQIFDDISYGKGGSVLRMLEDYIGEKYFESGIKSYLKDHAYSNATMNDLWESLERESNLPVGKIMSAWVTKAGHPVIKVQKSDGKTQIEQKRFKYLSLEDEVWPLPLTYYSDGKKVVTLLENVSGQINKFEKINVEGKGFYKVLYSNWDEPLGGAKNAYDKWNILTDAYSSMLANLISVDKYLSLTDRFMGESSYLPALTLLSQLTTLYLIFGDKMKQTYQKHLNSLYENWKSKNDFKAKMFNGILLRRFSLVNERIAKDLATLEYFSSDPNIRAAIATSIAVSSERPFEELNALYKKAINDEDRVNVLAGMLNIRKKEDFQKVLDMLKNGEVKKQDLRYITNAVTNPQNYDSLWIWVQGNIDFLRSVFAKSGALPRLLSALIPYLGLDREAQVREFFEKNKIEEASMGIKNGLELLSIYKRLRDSFKASL